MRMPAHELVVHRPGDIVEIPFPWEQAVPIIVNRLRPIDGIEDTRTLVAILFPEPDQEDRDQFSAWS